MKNIKRNFCMLLLALITLSGLSITSSSCAASSGDEPIGLYQYNLKKTNKVRSNYKVRDPKPPKFRRKS